jgi:alanine-synthesizing transaminase
MLEKKLSMHYNFPAFSLPPYPLGSIASAVKDLREKGEDIIDLSQINPNLGVPNIAVDKLVEACLRPSNHSYSSSQGISRLRQAASFWYKKRFSIEVCPEQEVVITLGSKEGISHLLLALVGAGDTILVPTPSYPILSAATVIAGAGFVGVPIDLEELANNNYILDKSSSFFENIEAIYKRTWPRPKVLLINFPHNPTSAIADYSFYERLVHLSKELNLLVINDFAYGDLVYGEQAVSLLSVPGAIDNCIECYSLSKGLGLAGWRIGFCVGNSTMVSALKKIKSYLDFGAFQALQVAVSKYILEHYEDAAVTIENSKSIYANRLMVLNQGLQNLGWNVSSIKSSVFVWAKMPENSKYSGSEQFAQVLLSEGRVAVCPGEGFDPTARRYVRFAAMSDEPRLRNAIQRIQNVSF